MATMPDRMKFEQAVAERLGINLEEALGGTLVAEYESGSKDVKVSWQSTRFIPMDEFNEILREAQQ